MKLLYKVHIPLNAASGNSSPNRGKHPNQFLYCSKFCTGRNQLWSGIVFLWYHSGIYIEDFTFIITIKVWVFDSYFFFWYHSGLYTMQEPSFLGKNALVSIWFTMVLTQIINSGMQRFSHLKIFTRYWNLTDVTILIPEQVLLYHYWCWQLIPCIHPYTWPTLEVLREDFDHVLYIEGGYLSIKCFHMLRIWRQTLQKYLYF